MEIPDEGRGFDPKVQTTVNHYGLDIMKTRARQSGGTLIIYSATGKGSNIVLEYPVGAQSSGSTRSVPGGDVALVQGLHPGTEKRAQRLTSILVVDDHDLFPRVFAASCFLEGNRRRIDLLCRKRPGNREKFTTSNGVDGHPDAGNGRHPGYGPVQGRNSGGSHHPFDRVAKPGKRPACHQSRGLCLLLKSIQSNELFDTIDEVLDGQVKFGPEMARQALAELTTNGDSPVHSIEPLNARHREVLKMVAQGFTYKEIGIRLHLAESTIKFHMGEIAVLLQVRNKAEAARNARGAGL